MFMELHKKNYIQSMSLMSAQIALD